MSKKSSTLANRPQHNRMDRVVTTSGKRASVRLPNASTIGYGKWHADPGDFVAFKLDHADGSGRMRYGRVVGRVDASGSSAGKDAEPTKGWICVAMLSDDLTFAHEMWIDPAWVQNCYASGPGFVRFFETFFTADPGDLLLMSEYGSLGASEGRTNRLPPPPGSIHLAKTRGGSECGHYGESHADIEHVTCPECIARHDAHVASAGEVSP